MGLWSLMVADFRILFLNIFQSLIYSLDDTATVKKVHIGGIRGKGSRSRQPFSEQTCGLFDWHNFVFPHQSELGHTNVLLVLMKYYF